MTNILSPKVSVVVPVFNGESTIDRCIKSILNQSLKEIQIIVVDDCSTDSTINRLNAIRIIDPRVEILRVNKNIGPYSARLRGIQAAKAPYVGFVDADDVININMYEKMYSEGMHENAEIVICGAKIVSKKGFYIAPYTSWNDSKNFDVDIFKQFCDGAFGAGVLWNKIFSKELLEYSIPKELCWRQDSSEDTILNIGAFRGAKRVRRISSSLYEHYENPNSITRKLNRANAYTKTLRAYALALLTYKIYGEEGYRCITNLYGRELKNRFLMVNSSDELTDDKLDLEEAITVISRIYPFGLAIINNKGIYRVNISTKIKNYKYKILATKQRFLSKLIYFFE